MGEPVGFLITWTCYGTWLHGDARGSVDDGHNVYDTPYLRASARRVSALRQSLRHAPIRFGPAEREMVARTIDEHCRRRDWEPLAINVRSNHVHVVVRYAGIAPEVMMGEWKAWSSRRLRENGMIPPGQSAWTRHGSTRYVWKQRDLANAVQYVVEGQDPSRFGEKLSEHRAPAR